MLAVVKTGGKQYCVSEGSVIKVEKLDVEAGQSLKLENILAIQNDDKVSLGCPNVKGAEIEAEVITHGKAKKINIIKFKRRKHHRKQMGHRQWYTELKITSIKA